MPIHNEEAFIPFSLPSIYSLEPSDVVLLFDRCTDESYRVAKAVASRLSMLGKTQFVIVDEPSNFRFRIAFLRNLGCKLAVHDIVLRTDADIVLDLEIKEYVELIGEYGLISFEYVEFPVNWRHLIKRFLAGFLPFDWISGVRLFDRKLLKFEDLEELKSLESGEDTHLAETLKKFSKTMYVKSDTVHLRPREDKETHLLRGRLYARFNRGILMALACGLTTFRLGLIKGFIQERVKINGEKKKDVKMNKKQIDVVICTKNRSHLLEGCISRLSKLIPYNQLYIYEGSEHPNWKVLDKISDEYPTKTVIVPSTMKFGAVRNLAIKTSNADYVAMIDDDIILANKWFTELMKAFTDDKVVAVCCSLLFQHPIIGKLSIANTRTSGGSGGASIYDRQKVLDVGNFNENIHRGEDMELELRIVASGQKWVRNTKTYAFHPITMKEFLSRAKANVVGWDFIMRESKHRTVFIVKRFGSTLVMPIYYFWKTFDLRCAGLWGIYKLQGLLYWLSGRYVK